MRISARPVDIWVLSPYRAFDYLDFSKNRIAIPEFTRFSRKYDHSQS